MVKDQKVRGRFKHFVYCLLWRLLSLINKWTKHKKNIILFYDRCPFEQSDNNNVLYNYLIRNKYNEKYLIYVVSDDYKIYKNNQPNNVRFVSAYIGHLVFLRAGFVFYRASFLPISFSNDQIVLQMWHGSPLKGADRGQLRNDGWVNTYYTNFLSSSEYFNNIWSRLFSLPHSRIIVSGSPRLDLLYDDIHYKEFKGFEKIILWAPTYRKTLTGVKQTKKDSILPILCEKDYSFLDNWLKSYKVKLIVKLHPLQSLDSFQKLEFDNFCLLQHSAFIDNHWNIYHLLSQCDALITDYSNVFYDYLLLNRPIGFTVDDIEDYASTRGFLVDDVDGIRPGYKIKNKDSLLEFIKTIVDGSDCFNEERKKINDLCNTFQGKHNCQQLLELLNITI